ncbi:hypothetical protein [Pseudoalteromonas sp.]|uniref:hypothetical protein n=1 Tax=Pseudoalteromonas sp. TaxID=53249 RepID=UPI00356B56F9
MKVLALVVIIYLLFFTDLASLIAHDAWQLPLWIADISWVGLELISALAMIVFVVVAAVLMALGVVGFAGVIVAGALFACLFGSLLIAWPLLLIAALCWLVADNKKVAS